MRAYLVVIAILVVIFGSIGFFLYQRFAAFSGGGFAPPPVTIAASVARSEQWRRTLDAVGTVRAVRGVELTSETSGVVTQIHFQSGTNVDAGQPLVVLNDEVEIASRQNQIASLELAEILFERDRKLVQQKSIPQTQFDQSRATLERARAQLAETEARLANKRIAAPFSGTIGIRSIEVGDYVSPGALIATLQDHSELEIDFSVPARFARDLQPGLPVTFSVDGQPDKIYRAEVAAIDSRVDPSTRNVLLRAAVLDPSGLLPGMFATLQVDLTAAEAVVTVPETALTYSLQGDIVYVITEQEGGGLTAEPRVVDSGAVRDGRVALRSGVSAGERVVSAGQNKLYRGVRVVVDDAVKL